jgi:hypothetical protein
MSIQYTEKIKSRRIHFENTSTQLDYTFTPSLYISRNDFSSAILQSMESVLDILASISQFKTNSWSRWLGQHLFLAHSKALLLDTNAKVGSTPLQEALLVQIAVALLMSGQLNSIDLITHECPINILSALVWYNNEEIWCNLWRSVQNLELQAPN